MTAFEGLPADGQEPGFAMQWRCISSAPVGVGEGNPDLAAGEASGRGAVGLTRVPREGRRGSTLWC